MVGRTERKLDMMPLLDIFMTVLFLFATIQEGQIEVTTYEAVDQRARAEAQRVRAEALEKAIKDANLELRQQQLEKATASLEAERERVAEVLTKLGETKQSLDNSETALRDAKLKIADMEKKAKQAIDRVFKSEDQFREDDILEKLLQQQMVYEIEIKGVIDPALGVVNHCCYRVDPRTPRWNDCGSVPAEEELRNGWFSTGADGLIAALRNTKGGNPVTIIRQDATATYLIGDKVASSVRGQIPELKVYNEGIVGAGMSCKVE